jgi:iron complex outermembrane receptor protein
LSSKSAETTYQFWVDRSSRNSQLYEIRLDAVDADVQHRRKISENHELHLGAGYRLTADSLIGNKTFRFEPSSRTDSLSNVMLRDEHQWLQSRLTLSAGIRAEHNAYTGFEWQPSIRLLFTPTKSQSYWASYSRAVRTPSRAEHDSDSVPLTRTVIESIPVLFDYTGNRAMNAERIKEWALGYRYQRRQRWSVDISAFHNSLSSLASVEPGRLELKPGPELRLRQLLFAGNGRVGEYRGVEVAGSGTITQNWKVHGSYSYLSQWTNLAPGSRDIYGPRTGEEPRHQFKFRSLYNISRLWQFDTSLYQVASIPAQEIPSRLRIDSRLGWRPNRKHDLSIVAQDLLNQRQLEFPSELFVYAVPVRRTMLLRWTVRF